VHLYAQAKKWEDFQGTIGGMLFVCSSVCSLLQAGFQPTLDPSDPAWGWGAPFLPFIIPCQFTSSPLAFLLSFFPFLIYFAYFLLLSIPPLSTRIQNLLTFTVPSYC